MQIFQKLLTEWNVMRANAFKEYADTYAMRGEHERVVHTCTKAIHLNPDQPEVYNRRGCARYQLGDTAGAIEDFTKALELDPKYIEAYLNRGLVYYHLDELADAMGDFNMAIYYDPKRAAAYKDRGLVDERQGNDQGALCDYMQSLALLDGRRKRDAQEVAQLIAALDGTHR